MMLTKGQFLDAMAAEYVVMGWPENDARAQAENDLSCFLEFEGVEFGHKDFSWNADAAKEVAREAASYD